MQTLFGGFTGRLRQRMLELTGELPSMGIKNEDLLNVLRLNDWEGYRQFSHETCATLPKVEPDPERERLIREQRQKDKVEFYGDSFISGVETFDNFRVRANYPDVAAALEAVQRWSRRGGPCLVTLSGTPGVGKTHLALAAARAMMQGGCPVMYRTEGAILESLHRAMRQGEQGVEEVLSEYLEIPTLVLDELGGQATSEWDKARMDRIIDARWKGAEAQMWTLITTNLVGDSMPARMASRLRDGRWCRTVIIAAPDYRVHGERINPGGR